MLHVCCVSPDNIRLTHLASPGRDSADPSTAPGLYNQLFYPGHACAAVVFGEEGGALRCAEALHGMWYGSNQLWAEAVLPSRAVVQAGEYTSEGLVRVQATPEGTASSGSSARAPGDIQPGSAPMDVDMHAVVDIKKQSAPGAVPVCGSEMNPAVSMEEVSPAVLGEADSSLDAFFQSLL